METDEATTSRIYDELMPMFSDDGHFDPKALAVLARSFVEMKTLAGGAGHEQALHRSISAEEMTAAQRIDAITTAFTLALCDSSLARVGHRSRWPRRPRAADKLRVGKAVPEAFSFVPLDVGMRNGIFQKNDVDARVHRLRGRRAHAAGRRRRLDRHPARLRARDGVHRQGLADQGRRRHGRPAAAARDRGAAGRAEDRRRSQGQDGQRLDRRLADLLAGQRDLAPAGLGPERHHHRADGRHAGPDRRAQARRYRRHHHGHRQRLRPREEAAKPASWSASPTSRTSTSM